MYSVKLVAGVHFLGFWVTFRLINQLAYLPDHVI